ncbi:MAG: hypothetical protein JO099_15455, partial [Acidobacteriia bacterium]|nr:hypothetical protein [Terriglobia bacterium]
SRLVVQVYDNEVPAVLIEPNSIQINPTTFDVTITFAAPQSGTIIISAAGGGGGVSSVTSVFGRLGTITAQAGDYTAAQVINAAQTNAGNTFTAGTQDFSGAAHTLPAKVGTAANKPATCTTGEMYFATDATAGQNWYYCTAANTWTPQVAGGGSGGGVSSITSVFGRLGTITAQAGDYTAAQVVNAAQTNAGNTFTAGTQDFSGAAHTLPAKVGTAANKPATCITGEVYFATDATAGQNWYYCTAANTWTPQVAGGGSGGTGGMPDPGSNGIVARTGSGATAARQLAAGSGITVTNGDGSAGNPAVSLNTAVALTNANAQANKPWFCNSTTGNTSYACSLSAAAPLTAYTAGQCFDLLVDTSNTGAATLSIDGLGTVPIKLGDGITNPVANQIMAGRETRICYDGTVFRLPTALPITAVSLNGTAQGTYSALNFVTSVGLNWQLPANGQTLSIGPQLDTAIVPSKIIANTYAPGAKQSLSPNTNTAGLNIGSAPLPFAPATGDIAIDGAGNLNWYDGAGWRLGTVADSVLPVGVPVLGNGANHLTAGTVTGTGSSVMSNAPVINNPVITSYVNANHDHSSAANGGPISNTAFATAATFSDLPACSSSMEGSRGAVTDSTTNTWGATVTGGGALHVLAYCDGTNWTVAAK